MLDYQKHKRLIDLTAEKIGIEVKTLIEMLRGFDAYPRDYHNSDHILDLCAKIFNRGHNDANTEKLLLITAVFHDYIYDPRSKTNEEDSAEEFLGQADLFNLTEEEKTLIYNTIIDTKGHVARTPFSETFCFYDLSGFTDSPRRLIEAEMRIRNEYSWVEWDDYVKGKLEFLSKYREIPIVKSNPQLAEGIDYVTKYIESVA